MPSDIIRRSDGFVSDAGRVSHLLGHAKTSYMTSAMLEVPFPIRINVGTKQAGFAFAKKPFYDDTRIVSFPLSVQCNVIIIDSYFCS